jgi:hypothetical protein
MDNEETLVLDTMRAKREPARSYMSAAELSHIRINVLRVVYRVLAEQLIDPSRGNPISVSTLCRWSNGTRNIPRWAAQRIVQLAEIARRNDAMR